jgi:serine/threonine protein kinase
MTMDEPISRDTNSESKAAEGQSDAEQPDEGRLFQAVQSYLHELEQGRRPSRREWLARYPELGPALRDCLDGLGLIRDAAASISVPRSAGSDARVGVQAGTPIGDFHIIREIGRGGMGIIYEATQLSLGRRVALKVLPFAAGLDNKFLQRFRLESQAAAQLHHNNIVPVFGVGCDRGVHFYAMQLIDGVSLDRVIRLLRREDEARSPGAASTDPPTAQVWSDLASHAHADDIPTGSIASTTVADRGDAMEQTLASVTGDLSTRQTKVRPKAYRAVARLMEQAADALEYSHQQGIIHRDIKPANLLVDKQRHLWITDFGLAHLHDEQNLTRTGELLGTILYASPEQVSGQRVLIDQRTDLYSLGATFYELLTLRPVFSGSTRHALLQQVLTEEPVRPRTLDHNIPPELETIVLKLLSKTPAERYNSAQELVDDLRRFLRDEPIIARPPTLRDRMRKWGRRHPAYVGAAVLVMFVVLLLSGISNWFIAKANSRTHAALAAEQLRAEEAESRFAQARQAVDLLVDLSEHDLAKPPLQPLQKQVLEEALRFYQDFVSQYRGNPSREAELVAVEKRLQKVLDDLLVVEGIGQLLLLTEKDVQTDLGLREADSQHVQQIAREFSQQSMTLLRGDAHATSQERRARFLDLARSSEGEMRSILGESQVQRLEQIRIQLAGFIAFSEPKIVKALGLTESQRESIRQIEAETFLMIDEGKILLLADDEPTASDGPQRKVSRASLHRSALDKCLAVLSPTQLNQWHELVDRPFQGQLSRRLPGMLP